MKLENYSPSNFKALGRSLEPEMSLGDIVMMGKNLGNMSDRACKEIIEKMNPKLLPSDYNPSQNRQIILMASMCVI